MRQVKEPTSVIGSLFWDAKSGTFSLTRPLMIFTNVFGLYLMWDVRNLMHRAFETGKEIYGLEWYLVAIGTYLLTGNSPYIASKWSSRQHNYPAYEPVIVNEEDSHE